MQSLEYNLELASLMLAELNSFLLTDEAFWPLGETASTSGPPFPRMSLGQLMLTFDELQVQAERMEPKQIQQFQDLSDQLEAIRAERPVNLEKKALAETKQRANLWSAYINDLRESERAVASYSQDVKHRVMVDRLQSFYAEDRLAQDVRAKVESADQGLRGIFQQGGFIWHPRLKPLYDREAHWFLFGRPIPQ